MKIKSFLSLTTFLSLMTFNAMAGQDRGGGDLCENRIRIISTDIQRWILKGGGEKLKLPADISSTVYSNDMLKAIEHASIRCVSKGDIGHPVTINQTPKVCVYDKLVGSGEITCDSDKFSQISESDQYVLVHHEFAGLAGIENPEGSNSNYDISNQLSGFLEDQVVKKLTITPPTEVVTEIASEARCRVTWKVNSYFTSIFGKEKLKETRNQVACDSSTMYLFMDQVGFGCGSMVDRWYDFSYHMKFNEINSDEYKLSLTSDWTRNKLGEFTLSRTQPSLKKTFPLERKKIPTGKKTYDVRESVEFDCTLRFK